MRATGWVRPCLSEQQTVTAFGNSSNRFCRFCFTRQANLPTGSSRNTSTAYQMVLQQDNAQEQSTYFIVPCCPVRCSHEVILVALLSPRGLRGIPVV
jgi:hypothetical protein